MRRRRFDRVTGCVLRRRRRPNRGATQKHTSPRAMPALRVLRGGRCCRGHRWASRLPLSHAVDSRAPAGACFLLTAACVALRYRCVRSWTRSLGATGRPSYSGCGSAVGCSAWVWGACTFKACIELCRQTIKNFMPASAQTSFPINVRKHKCDRQLIAPDAAAAASLPWPPSASQAAPPRIHCR